VDAFLKINEKKFSGWKSFAISKSIETLSGSFNFSVNDNWSGLKAPWPIQPNDKAEVYLGDTKLITGYVEVVRNSLSSTDTTIEVSGRDIAADLVDCSADISGGEIKSQKLEALAAWLLGPFGLKVLTSVDTGSAFPNFRITQGQSVFEILDKKIRQKGFLLISNENGTVEITEPGEDYALTGIVEGQNIMSSDASFDFKDRFSKYTVKAANDLEVDGMDGYKIIGRATDEGVPRFRPLVIVGESAMTLEQAKKRAQYEASVRAARSVKVSVTLSGFTQRDGSIWKMNQLVRVNSPTIGIINETLLICDVSYSLSEGAGAITTLGLKRKDAFIPVPTVNKSNNPDLGIQSNPEVEE